MATATQRPQSQKQNQQSQNQNHAPANPPAETLRFGTVAIRIFENESTKDGRTFKFWKARVDKSYVDQQGEWKQSNSYNVDELLRLRALLDRAINFMMERPTDD